MVEEVKEKQKKEDKPVEKNNPLPPKETPVEPTTKVILEN